MATQRPSGLMATFSTSGWLSSKIFPPPTRSWTSTSFQPAIAARWQPSRLRAIRGEMLCTGPWRSCGGPNRRGLPPSAVAIGHRRKPLGPAVNRLSPCGSKKAEGPGPAGKIAISRPLFVSQSETPPSPAVATRGRWGWKLADHGPLPSRLESYNARHSRPVATSQIPAVSSVRNPSRRSSRLKRRKSPSIRRSCWPLAGRQSRVVPSQERVASKSPPALKATPVTSPWCPINVARCRPASASQT